ncbi:hypothetical protein EMCRGX_G010863 [Ephydatia muelleri]
MALTARVLYDFDGDTENGELIIKEGDKITVLNQDVGDGWWEGQVGDGPVGLFPESYVELVQTEHSQSAAAVPTIHEEDPAPEDHTNDAEDDEWDNENDEEPRGGAGGGGAGHGGSRGYESALTAPDDPASSLSPTQSSVTTFGRKGTVHKDINRFTSFVKTGTEPFILGKVTAKGTDADKITIVLSPEGTPMWEPFSSPYTVDVANPEKKKKYYGMKKFTAYEVTITSDNGQGPTFYGRYGENFVEKRRQKLQYWSNRIARHPVLCRSFVVNHFFEASDNDWKAGKRRAERDELCGGAMLSTVQHPEVVIDLTKAESAVEHFGVFMKQLHLNLSKTRLKFIDHCNQMSGPFMGEWHKMAAVIKGLSTCFALEETEYATQLNRAMALTAEVYMDIGSLHAEQPKYDMLPALDTLKEYIGMIQVYPDLLTVHRGAMGKVKESDKMKEEGRIDYQEASEIHSRCEVVSAVCQAEIYHFQHERIVDFRMMMKGMLDAQIAFYKEIVQKLETTAARFSDDTNL